MTEPLNLREVGRVRVLQALQETGGTSRPELVRRTGLSRATVSALTAELIAAGLLREDEPSAEERGTGRPAQSLSLVPSAGYAIGADIGHQHVRVVLCDLSGTPRWDRVVAKDVDREPEATLELTVELIDEASKDIPRERVLGLGVGIASPVRKDTGELSGASIMPGWAGRAVGAELTARTGLPTLLTNDANAGALAERRYGAGQSVADMVYIRLSAGIGAGIVSDGTLLLGATGLAGEIGHLPVASGGPICRCGNRGCLETVASPVAIARLLAESWHQPITPADLPRLIAANDRGTLRAVEDAGTAVGTALATFVTLFNPELVVVGGDLAEVGDLIFEPIRRAIRRYALPTVAEQVSVVPGALGAQAEVRGAAALVLATAPTRLTALPVLS
ncbi:MAG TPA: ROK family transcriptional regulator [Pseudonocardiaceae bacterium]